MIDMLEALVKAHETAREKVEAVGELEIRKLPPVTESLKAEFSRLLEFPFGIQPLEGPVGLIFRLVIAYMEELNPEDNRPGSNDEELVKETGRKLSIQIVKEAVEAKSRKYNILDNVADVIVWEAIGNILLKSQTTDIGEVSDQRLLLEINKACNSIARDTRRGAGNGLIASPTTAKRIKAAAIDGKSIVAGFKIVEHAGLDDATIIVSYKGGAGETDAGIIISPYQFRLEDGNSGSGITRYGISASYERAYEYYRVIKIA